MDWMERYFSVGVHNICFKSVHCFSQTKIEINDIWYVDITTRIRRKLPCHFHGDSTECFSLLTAPRSGICVIHSHQLDQAIVLFKQWLKMKQMKYQVVINAFESHSTDCKIMLLKNRYNWMFLACGKLLDSYSFKAGDFSITD